ncbi:MAG: SGNH/GDSL hydrolase family protein [Rhodothermales bacterium]
MSSSAVFSPARLCVLLTVILLAAGIQPLRAQDDPDPGRFAEEIADFEAWDMKNVTPERPILFVGSSSIRIWLTGTYFPDLPVINRGFGGSHISDVNFYLERIVLKYAPRAIVFYAGDNDIAGGKSPERVLDDYKVFVSRVHALLPKTKIFFIPIKPSLLRWDMWPQMMKANAMVATYSEASPYLYYIDIATPMLGTDGTPRPEFFREDGLHLNREGYDLWTQIVRPQLLSALALDLP